MAENAPAGGPRAGRLAAERSTTSGRRPPDRRGERRSPRGFLYAGRSIVAALAALLLVVTGFEYTLLRTTDTTLAESSIDAVQTDDPNIKTPTRSTATDPTATDAAVAPQVYEPENILLLGSDTRAGDNGDTPTPTHSTEGDRPVRHADDRARQRRPAAHHGHLHPARPPRRCSSVQGLERRHHGRCSDDDFPISEGERWKITNAYAVGGPACTVKAVQQLTGLKIDRVIGIDFLGFKTMVDALDGIKVNVCQRIDDAELGWWSPTGGEQVVTRRPGAEPGPGPQGHRRSRPATSAGSGASRWCFHRCCARPSAPARC